MQPQDIQQATKEQLVDRYMEIGYKEEELAAEKQVLKEELLSRMKDDAEKIGDFLVTKVSQKRYSFGKITVDQARDLGATKETVDNDTLKTLFLRGVKLPIEVTVNEITYPLIKHA